MNFLLSGGGDPGCHGTYTFEWGDGSPSWSSPLRETAAHHTYRTPGRYSAILTQRYAPATARCSFRYGYRHFSTQRSHFVFTCGAGAPSCESTATGGDYEGVFGPSSRPIPAKQPPSTELAHYKNRTRPRACVNAKDCFNRRIEVFDVSFSGTQTTTWKMDGKTPDSQGCSYSGGGSQTITFSTAKPQPAAIWVQRGAVVKTPSSLEASFEGTAADTMIFVGPTRNPANLFDFDYQNSINQSSTNLTLPVRFQIERDWAVNSSCANAPAGQTFKDARCGRRSGTTGFAVWLKYDNLVRPRPFVLWSYPLGFALKSSFADPYDNACYIPLHASYLPNEHLGPCFKHMIDNAMRGTKTVGQPPYGWSAEEGMLLFDPGTSSCLTGASPQADLSHVLDCGRKRIVIQQPGFDLNDETTGPGRPPEGADDAVGWTETTHVQWTLTLDRVGCGRTGSSPG